MPFSDQAGRDFVQMCLGPTVGRPVALNDVEDPHLAERRTTGDLLSMLALCRRSSRIANPVDIGTLPAPTQNFEVQAQPSSDAFRSFALVPLS